MDNYCQAFIEEIVSSYAASDVGTLWSNLQDNDGEGSCAESFSAAVSWTRPTVLIVLAYALSKSE